VPPGSLQQVITDKGISEGDLQVLKNAGIEVTLV